MSVFAARSAQTWIRHRRSRFSCLPSVSGFKFAFGGLSNVGLLSDEVNELNFPLEFELFQKKFKIANHYRDRRQDVTQEMEGN